MNPEENKNQPIEQPQNIQSSERPAIVSSSTGQQLQPIVSQPLLPNDGGHKLLKTWLVVSLIILILNGGLLALTLIPFAGVYIAIGAAPILLATGLLGLVNIFVTLRALSKNYFSGGFKKVTTTVLVLSVMAVLGGASSPFILAAQHKENVKTQEHQDKVNSYYSEVTVEKATELLNSCKIYKLSYSNGKGGDWEKTPESTASGILTFDEYNYMGQPTSSAWNNARGKYQMYLADRTVNTIVPIARQAQKTCDIQFYHDGADEVKQKDGRVYFKGEPIN
ncbi:MAG: hypothetical protein QG629_231 [Patescibacteria group bacterium]|nr:hypothetical protein [Candidatus Saccharibacteria bacterium]MDQ5963149.1 hypothetical protein [Patescibacteria group bacterium]